MCLLALAGMAQMVGALCNEAAGHRFNYQPGHTPRLWVRSLDRARSGGNGSVFLSLPSSGINEHSTS